MSEYRDHTRLPVHWPVMLMVDGLPRDFRGRTIDLGMGGAGIVIDASLPMQGMLTFCLGLPPTLPGRPFVAIEIRCRIAHAEYSSEHESFRAGIEFRSFVGDGERLLADALALRGGGPRRRQQPEQAIAA